MEKGIRLFTMYHQMVRPYHAYGGMMSTKYHKIFNSTVHLKTKPVKIIVQRNYNQSVYTCTVRLFILFDLSVFSKLENMISKFEIIIALQYHNFSQLL